MLKEIFTDLVQKYTDDSEIILQLWNEIEKAYSTQKRYYHNLSHLENLFLQLSEVKNLIEDWDTILFSLFFHDVIYDAKRSDNEEKSAEFAQKRLQILQISTPMIEKCCEQILATKGHTISQEADTNYFTDADLSILGQDEYLNYAQNVRKEYAIFPDFLYNPGRKKVLKHFLEMEYIFKTAHFYDKYEQKAKLNLQNEIEML